MRLIKFKVFIRLVSYKRYIRKQLHIKRKAIKSKLDLERGAFDFNAINNIDKVNGLYKQLVVRCHPDKFVGSDKLDIAKELFQRVASNKSNFTILSQLNEEIETKLH